MSGPARLSLQRDGVEDLARNLAPPPPDPGISDTVAGILADVRRRGDDALVDLVRRFDCPTFTSEMIRVPREALDAAAQDLDSRLRESILVAADQVRALAALTRPDDVDATLPFGQRIAVRAIPVASAGVYVPGGRAAYPSSVVMAVVPARVAGVDRIALASPPGPSGLPADVVLATAELLGVDEVYAVGGPAAIGALAFGTGSVAPVSVIAGPGNAWVQEAKRQVVGRVGIDSVAGPSEVVVLAGTGADPEALALDLLAQAEHGPDSPAILVSPDAALVDEVAQVLSAYDVSDAVALIDCASLDVAVLFVEAFAPEHLEVDVPGAHGLADSIRNAGAVFVGPNGGTAFGDYVAGSNHILPTGGSARFASAVGPATFMRRMSVIDLPDAAVSALTPHLARIADAEGYSKHRRSAEVRAARIAREGGSQ